MTRRSPTPDSVTFGPAAAGPGFRVGQVDYAAGYRQAPHAHEKTGITLVLAGKLRETARGREEYASALSVVVKPAGTLHADLVGPGGARTVLVEIPDPASALPMPHALGAWRWLHAGAGVRPLLGMRRALLDPDPESDLEDLFLELLGEVAPVPAPAPGDAPAWVRRAREVLDDLAPAGIRVRDLAERVGVHPVSLTRAFRRAYGVPVSVYRRRLRLQRAAAQVTATERALSRIAHAVGYADHAHMCREVRDATGFTPSRLRELAHR